MISVIVPIYNVEPYLHECLESILNQTYQNLEILLIDDGSQDDCGRICDEFARIDPRIRVFHTENHGLSVARNLGLQMAKGEYIGFVDSDDWLEPDMYEILLRCIEETGTNISVCGIRYEYLHRQEDHSIDKGVYFGTEAICALICNLPNYAWNKLYKKACWIDISFPENHTYEDVATIYKVVLKADSLSCVPKALYHYRKREESIVYTKSMKNIMDYWFSFYGRYVFFRELPKVNIKQEDVDKAEREIAFVAVNIWRGIFIIPKKQRDYTLIHEVSDFVKDTFPLFGKKDWNWILRAGIFFCRYPNELSFIALYVPNIFYNLSKRIIKKPFPSCSH